jgi:uncharacterized membrane protein (Fun14 family)
LSHQLVTLALYPLTLGLLGGFLTGFLLRRLGKIIAATVAIAIFILNTLPFLRILGLTPSPEWLEPLMRMLPASPHQAMEEMRRFLPIVSNLPFIVGFFIGAVLGFKAA